MKIENQQLIEKFYSAFKNKNAAEMQACYHDEAVFKDPVFGELNRAKAAAMWRMLCENGKDLKIEFSDVFANDKTGGVTWQARYTFSKTGRKVHNVVHAKFEFKEGKIKKHNDDFNFYAWNIQAFGFTGRLLGFLPFFKNKVRSVARKSLEKYIKNHGF